MLYQFKRKDEITFGQKKRMKPHETMQQDQVNLPNLYWKIQQPRVLQNKDQKTQRAGLSQGLQSKYNKSTSDRHI